MTEAVHIAAPARLHMGFLDLSGSLGRHYGSVGVALNELETRLSIRSAHELSAQGPCAQRAKSCARNLTEALKVPDTLAIDIETAIPEHVGLGSGTQLSLAVGLAISELYGLGHSVRDIAVLTGRGARSGIGIAAFEQGGFIVDGGSPNAATAPPVISRMPIPEDWRFLLAFDDSEQGFHDQQELSAFNSLPPFGAHQAAHLCHQILMQTLPCLAEEDLSGFGAAITGLQQTIGDYFAPAQGGRFTSAEIGEVIEWLGTQGAVALGQSSWGPTGFCLVENNQQAKQLLNVVRDRYRHRAHLSFRIASVRNQGGNIERVQVNQPVLRGRCAG